MESTSWYPVARSDDLPQRHVFHGQLHGVELALWRADDGQVNAWENRCPHRSVRFSLGVNTGKALNCQYHGWQYRSGDGRCVYIPASIDGNVPSRLCARTFATTEAAQYVWVNLDIAPQANPCLVLPFEPLPVTLRSVVIHAGLDAVRSALTQYVRLDEEALPGSVQTTGAAAFIGLSWESRSGEKQRLCFGLQPVDAAKTVVHVSTDRPWIGGQHAIHWHNSRLTRIRRDLEDEMTRGRPMVIESRTPRYIPIRPVAIEATPAVPPKLIMATVAERWSTAEGILGLRLSIPADVNLPFEPGSHIDVHTPAGMIRQYSLVNSPDERNAFILGVKNEPQSRGGSRSLNEMLKVGEHITVSTPKNNFALSTTPGALLIAGGIGITPVLSMAQALSSDSRPFCLHYFARSPAHVAFSERIETLSGVQLHLGLEVDETQRTVQRLLAALPDDRDVYVCGPRPLIDCVRDCAQALRIADSRVHVELFANEVSAGNDKPFRVRLARSGREMTVPAGVSLAAALNAAGVPVDTSCEQGVCGTCRIAVVNGLPDHRDVYLTETEKAGDRCMMPCVSRSRSDLLVLDL